ncbi:MAG: Rrf2 family transcriptional regulator [Sphingopyxis sp.]|nr:Rrf2 family transcriptional regulator [Sphingopyxis sp.]
MRFTMHTDFALRTLMFLAVKPGQHTIDTIADHYGISRNHLMKVAQRLVAEGFVTSTRGRGGGLQLARPAETINLGAVVRALEDVGGFVECFDAATNQCRVTPACGLRGILAGGVAAFMRHMDGYSLADLVPNPDRFRAALNIPALQ